MRDSHQSVVSTDNNMPTRSPGREKTLEHRKKAAVIIICVQLMVSLLGFSIAMRAYVTTTNIKAGAFWSHLLLLFACLFLLIGVCQHQQEKSWMVIGMVANVLGILMAFIGTLVDGSQAGHIAQTNFENCEYSFETRDVSCHRNGPAENLDCGMTVYQESCYCCYVLRENHCDVSGLSLSSQPNIFRGVKSCDQVAVEYQLFLWLSTALNLVQFIVATITVSLVSRYKTILTQSLHPTTIHQTIVGPSVISHRVHGNPVMIINQQTVGYYPGVMEPPAYSEVVGIGPYAIQPTQQTIAPVETGVPEYQEDRTDNSCNTDQPPDYPGAEHSEPVVIHRSMQHSIVGNRLQPISRQTQASCDSIGQTSTLDRETSLPPPYSP